MTVVGLTVAGGVVTQSPARRAGLGGQLQARSPAGRAARDLQVVAAQTTIERRHRERDVAGSSR